MKDLKLMTFGLSWTAAIVLCTFHCYLVCVKKLPVLVFPLSSFIYCFTFAIQISLRFIKITLDKTEWEHTPRLFNLNSLSGTFNASEILNPVRSENAVSAFPFLQSDMYSVTQPGMIIIFFN